MVAENGCFDQYVQELLHRWESIDENAETQVCETKTGASRRKGDNLCSFD